MTHNIQKTLVAFALLVGTACTAQASADTLDHIDQLATRIERKSNQIVRETKHYRNTPEYAHLLSDAREMARLAEHIHDVAHGAGSLPHMQSDLAELDSSFHHIESMIDQIELNAYYGCRIVQGRTAHVKRLLNSIEDDIHHIQEDLATLLAPPACTIPRATVYKTRTYSDSSYGNRSYNQNSYHSGRSNTNYYRGSSNHTNSYNRGHGGSGLSIGGGSSKITFRF